VARDRKRAKQRRQRSQQRAAVKPSQPRRENVPGELEHASGQVDEFEATLVAGADGQEVEETDGAVAEDEDVLARESDDGPAEWDDEEQPLEDPGEDDRDTAGAVATATPEVGPTGATVGPAARPPARREGNPVANFLRASWAELQRVQWPDRRAVAQATAVVLGFVALAGAYLGVADALFSRFVDAIL
jgi:preprotein translocase subunit SecE